VFIYTCEAHPGEHVRYHDTFDRKVSNARLLRDEAGIRRPILVDDLSGTVHRRYGAMPNMTWVIDRGGRVAYKANWTSAANVEAFLARFLGSRRRRPPGTELAMHQTEQAEYRYPDRKKFTAHLARNGPSAAREFDRARELWARRTAD